MYFYEQSELLIDDDEEKSTQKNVRRHKKTLAVADRGAITEHFFFFSSFFISLIADGPHHYHPACGHQRSSHLSPVYALQFFIAMQVQHSYNSSTNGWILLTHVPTLSVTKERT